MTVYRLSFASGTPVEVRPTGYGDTTSASRDALMWAAATGQTINVVTAQNEIVGIASADSPYGWD